MPELPEVETIKRGLEGLLQGLFITGVKIIDGRVIFSPSTGEFVNRLRGRRFCGISRRGKALIVHFADVPFCLVVQLMMTGQLVYTPIPRENRATKVVFTLSNDHYLHYNDQRLFGRLRIVDDISTVPYFVRLGPEPLGGEFTLPWLAENLLRHRTAIKVLLMNHAFIAGIGNIYASEILFVAGIDPRRPANSLTPPETKRLYRAVGSVLKSAIEHRGTSMNTYRDAEGQRGDFISRIRVYDREEENCFVCRSLIQKRVLGGRSTFFCPRCQK